MSSSPQAKSNGCAPSCGNLRTRSPGALSPARVCSSMAVARMGVLRGPSRMAVGGLLLGPLFFNTFGVVLDDAIHLHVDRKDPLRAHRWLVRGVLTPRQALLVALPQVPLLIAAHVTAGFSADTLPWILGAVLGQGIYDLYGKSCRVPPLMEAAEGGAAFLLVIYGAAVPTKALNSLVWQPAPGAGALLLLVNAFHGSLRDLDVEIGCNQRTTPIWLGCRGTDAG